MRTIRAFLALELPAAIRQEVNAIAVELAKVFPPKSVKWVPPQNIHLTLRFLGDTPENKLSSISAAVDTIAASYLQLELCLSDIGSFPSKSRPRVFWIGLDGEIAILQNIHGRLSQELSEIGWEPERRPFHPHLTLGRVKDRRAIARTSFDWGLPIDPIPFSVNRLVLIESDLGPSGAIYRVRHATILREPEDKT